MLPLALVLEELSHTLNEHDGVFVLALLLQNLDVEHDKLLVHLKSLLLHQLQHEQIGNVKNLRLKFEIQTNEVHRLDGPLSMQRLLVLLVKRQGLILLLQQVTLANVREEE